MCAEPAPLQTLNTLRLAATAAALRSPDSVDSLAGVLEEARAEHMPVVVLGEGSNIVLAGDLSALVLRYRALGRQVIREDDQRVTLRVAGGENWHALTVWALEQGYFGLENLALIPGTVGAAPIQNIGAYGVELSEFVECVHIVDIETGEQRALSAADCEFGYRHSVFKERLRDRCVITAVDMTLRRREAPNTGYAALADYLKDNGREVTAAEIHSAVVALRSARLPDPRLVPNAGSFFKNPVVPAERARELQRQNTNMPVFYLDDKRAKLPAGWLIEACGWKGYSAHGVGVHAAHALVLVNLGSGSGAALLELAARIQDSVRRRFACELEIEPRVYGRAA